ncbi:protein-disulfide reductase DsbD family protein [Hydrogenophaga sp. RWCD_12]|uniref:protein-disulfide reductase DsbD family protein n=1 Tax=Hydrogenophaga sp. RWCD_12 TaxID=3391190 RepID=UPI003984BBA0
MPSPFSLLPSFARQGLLLLACLLAAPVPLLAQGLLGAAGSPVVQTPQVRAELMAHAPEGVAPGARLWLGLQLTHQPEWHTYWKNSGDSGLPTELQWTLPAGVSAGEIAWPTPRKIPVGSLANYGYSGTVLLPVPLTVDPAFAGQQLDVTLHAAWLVCRKECIPEEGNFRLKIPAQGSTGLNGAAFDAAFDAAPKDRAAGASQVRPDAGHLNVSVDALPAAWKDKKLEFFPEPASLIDPGAPWTQRWDGARWTAQLPLSAQRSTSPAEIALVVALADAPGEGPGLPGVRMTVPVQGQWPAVQAMPAAVSPALQAALDANAARTSAPVSGGGGAPVTLLAALLGALLGGLILNLMPCVFPVLAIKVLAFAKHADDRAAHRRHGLAYTAGVVLSFLALGGLLLGLRAAGEAIGWGFQLQSPAVVATLATLFTVIGLNLAGLFEFGSVLPSGLASLQARHPLADAFLTGVLAVAVASPCTAPFMGASLGLAATLPTAQALAVFALLGLGMALPYLAASWWPAIARTLPRPGAWMERFRQFMAFPMFATVVWLLWVLGQQSGIDGVAALLMLLVALTLLIWALRLQGTAGKVLQGLSALALLGLLVGFGPQVIRLQAPEHAGAAVATSIEGLRWEAWSAARQTELVTQGRPVFVDFTAAWCVTCQFNKRNALADEALLHDLAAKNVALLRADWTRRDPAVTAALAELGRNGVPVYVLLTKGQPARVLTEVLSVSEVREALAAL